MCKVKVIKKSIIYIRDLKIDYLLQLYYPIFIERLYRKKSI